MVNLSVSELHARCLLKGCIMHFDEWVIVLGHNGFLCSGIFWDGCGVGAEGVLFLGLVLWRDFWIPQKLTMYLLVPIIAATNVMSY
ncbi:MAG: hypothetical protein D6735_12275 [Acidobacteria bacterium]|nr:MAG: hypothetical protein D6735_12275 [Acidobacteriota bacterium]